MINPQSSIVLALGSSTSNKISATIGTGLVERYHTVNSAFEMKEESKLTERNKVKATLPRPSAPQKNTKTKTHNLNHVYSQILKSSALAQEANFLPNMNIFPNQFFTNWFHSPQRLGVFQSILRVQNKPSIGHANIVII